MKYFLSPQYLSFEGGYADIHRGGPEHVVEGTNRVTEDPKRVTEGPKFVTKGPKRMTEGPKFV